MCVCACINTYIVTCIHMYRHTKTHAYICSSPQMSNSPHRRTRILSPKNCIVLCATDTNPNDVQTCMKHHTALQVVRIEATSCGAYPKSPCADSALVFTTCASPAEVNAVRGLGRPRLWKGDEFLSFFFLFVAFRDLVGFSSPEPSSEGFLNSGAIL